MFCPQFAFPNSSILLHSKRYCWPNTPNLYLAETYNSSCTTQNGSRFSPPVACSLGQGKSSPMAAQLPLLLQQGIPLPLASPIALTLGHLLGQSAPKFSGSRGESADFSNPAWLRFNFSLKELRLTNMYKRSETGQRLNYFFTPQSCPTWLVAETSRGPLSENLPTTHSFTAHRRIVTTLRLRCLPHPVAERTTPYFLH